jgi:hypothetical protein
MVAWRHDFVAVFGVMQDHGAVQCNHGAVPHDAIQKGSNCEIFADLIYFALNFPKKVNCSHFHQKDIRAGLWFPCTYLPASPFLLRSGQLREMVGVVLEVEIYISDRWTSTMHRRSPALPVATAIRWSCH